MMRKIISAILVLAMCVSLMGGITAGAVALDENGTVTYTFSSGEIKDKNSVTSLNEALASSVDWWKWNGASGAFVKNVVGFGGHNWYHYDSKWSKGTNDEDVAESVYMVQLNASNISTAVVKDKVYTLTWIDTGVLLSAPSEPGFYKIDTSVDNTIAGYMGVLDSSEEAPDISKYIDQKYSIGSAGENDSAFDKIIFSDGVTPLVFAWHSTANITKLSSLTLTKIDTTDVSKFDVTVTNSKYLYCGDSVKATLSYDSKAVADSFVEWYSTNLRAIKVVDNWNLTAVGGGRADVKAKEIGGNEFRAAVRLRVYQPDYVEAFGEDAYTKASATVAPSATASVAALDGTKLDYALETPVYNEETGTYSVSAPETIGEYSFRYWIKGLELNKQIVSLDREITAYTPHNGPNYLIAVYDKTDVTPSVTEYYNANGQKLENGDTFPYMAGYGQAKGWIDHKNGVKEADYGEPNSFEITIDDGINDSSTKTYKYGEPVECKTQAIDNKIFVGWFKTVNGQEELVSTELNYNFYAWERCSVTARHLGVLNEYVKPSGVIARRILLGTFDIGNGEQAVMAEFIGFDNAVERGITIGTNDYAMTQKNASQFVIINDAAPNTPISGYAILADGYKYTYKYTTPETTE